MGEQGAQVSKDEESGMASTIVVGILILGFAGWFLFGGRDDGGPRSDASKDSSGAVARADGSIGARASDPARRANRDAATNPQSREVVPAEPETEPRNREEKIARAERDLRRAKDRLTRIERGMERFDESRARAVENAPNAEIKEREYDRKAENIAKNLKLTKTRIDELEDTLANLRAGDEDAVALPAEAKTPSGGENAEPTTSTSTSGG